MTTSGTESKKALVMPVTRLVAPGPEEAMQTPAFPVILAHASAAKHSDCSLRQRTLRIPVHLRRAFRTSTIAPPGYAKTTSVPWSLRHWTRI